MHNSHQYTRVKGSSRQSTILSDGRTVERGYLYLPPEIWLILYEQAFAKGISGSKFVAWLIKQSAQDN